MAKPKKQDVKPNTVIDYETLRLDVLKMLIEERGIVCRQTKETMVKHLKLDDDGKYIRPIEYQKQSNGQYMVGIDFRDYNSCVEIGKLIEKNNAKRLNIYYGSRVFYLSNQKLS